MLFKDIIAKNIFPKLEKKDAYRLLRLISILIFLIAALGITAWVWTESDGQLVLGDQIKADCSAVNTGTSEGATTTVECSDKIDSN